MTKEKEEYVEVTVKVPKRLMELLEDQNYFGWSQEEYFTACMLRGTDCELNELDVTESERLQKKYGHDVSVLSFTRHKKLSKA